MKRGNRGTGEPGGRRDAAPTGEAKERSMAKKRLHQVDRKLMTIDEAAAMVGVTVEALRLQKSRFAGITVQHLVDMYRIGAIWPEKRGPDLHRVHGRWMTVNELAARFGLKIGSVWCWRSRHRGADGKLATLEAAYDHYMAIEQGKKKLYPGSAPRRLYRVDGRLISMRQAAEAVGVPEATLRSWVKRHGCTVASAVKRYEKAAEAARAEAAAREIMRALGY